MQQAIVRRRQTGQILDQFGRPFEKLAASFADSAETTRLNSRHWARAKSGDFNALIQGDLATLQRRARYEMLNNSYASGIADTLAFDFIGSGPKPQLNSGNEPFDQEAEERFLEWAAQCDFGRQMDLAEILQSQMALQQCEAGASITVLKREDIPYNISLRLLCVDIDRLDSSAGMMNTAIKNGIEFDSLGRPVAYHIRKYDPRLGYTPYSMQSERIMASDVIHLYRIKRPGQMHGIPWFTPVLDKFAQLRRFVDATLDSAETAAQPSAVISCKDPDSEASHKIQENDVLEFERNAMLVLPDNYETFQIKPEHPAATFEMFKAEIINEIARCVLMPYNVAAMNSAKYNYASGRLDHQKYHRFIAAIRTWGARRFLNRVFAEWLSEGYLLDGFFTTRPTFEQVMKAIRTIKWQWDGFEHVDPVKEADSQNTRLQKSGTTTLAAEYAKDGKDWRRETRQRLKEIFSILEDADAAGVPREIAMKLFFGEQKQEIQKTYQVNEDTAD